MTSSWAWLWSVLGKGPCSTITSPRLHFHIAAESTCRNPSASLLPDIKQQCLSGQTFNSCLAGPCSAACPWWEQGSAAAHEFKRCWPLQQRLERDWLQRELLFMVGIEPQISKPGGGRWKADNCVKIFHLYPFSTEDKTRCLICTLSQSTSASLGGTPFPKHWHSQCCGTFFSLLWNGWF